MFGFMSMAGNYEQRKVANDIINGATIDTAAVTDSEQPYETAINSLQYGDSWVVVEMYNNKTDAEAGHKKWVALFEKEFPVELRDVSTSEISKLRDMFSSNPDNERVIKKAL